MAEELKIMAAASQTEGVKNTIENPSLSRKEVVEILVKLFEASISGLFLFGKSLKCEYHLLIKNLLSVFSEVRLKK